jgi:hypothetical protein
MSSGDRMTLSLSSSVESETRTRLHVQDLRRILDDRMSEYQRLRSEWLSQKDSLRSELEQLSYSYRDLDREAAASQDSDKKKHLIALAELRENHKNEVLDLQMQIDDALTSDAGKADQDFDEEIASLKQGIANFDDQLPPTEAIELVDADADDRLQDLEDQLAVMQQRHDDALQQAEEESQKHTKMLEQLVLKQQLQEEHHEEAIASIIQILTQMDNDHAEKLDVIHQQIADKRSRILEDLKRASTKIQEMQQTVSERQREYSITIRELQEKADRLRASLDVRTARQQQHMRDSLAYARAYAEAKRKFATMHCELEILSAERLRESVEHESLTRELSKMDGYVLSQMSAEGGSGALSTSQSKRV